VLTNHRDFLLEMIPWDDCRPDIEKFWFIQRKPALDEPKFRLRSVRQLIYPLDPSFGRVRTLESIAISSEVQFRDGYEFAFRILYRQL